MSIQIHGNSQFSKLVETIYIPTSNQCIRIPLFHIFRTLGTVSPFNFSQSGKCVVVSISLWLKFSFLFHKSYWPPFHVHISHLDIIFYEVPVQVFCPCLLLHNCLFLLFCRSLCILDTSSLPNTLHLFKNRCIYKYRYANIFSQSVACLFILLMEPFDW